jgi:hypothetical protein
MTAFEKINGGTSFNEHQSLSWLLHIQKIGDRLFYSIIEDMKVFSPQAFREFARRIGNQNADANAINANADWFRLLHAGRRLRGWRRLRDSQLRMQPA